MNEGADFNRILDECLDALLSGQMGLEDCLARYPDETDALRPALQVALLTHHLKKPVMADDAVDALETRLRGEMLAKRRQRPPFFAPYRKLAAMIALVVLLTMAASGGAVAASANSLPGDFLYPLKRLWEAIILALSSLNHAQDDVWLHLAETRLDEAESLAERGLLNETILIDLYHSTAEAIYLADEDTAPQVMQYLQEARQRLNQLSASGANETLRDDILLLVLPSASGTMQPPDSLMPPSQATPSVEPSATTRPSLTPTVTFTPMPSLTPSPTASATPTRRPNVTPTSRVPATPTHTPTPAETATDTPSTTPTPSRTPTSTWTPLPLPGERLTQQPDDLRSGGGTIRLTPTRSATVDQTATVRYRDTQRAVYATQTSVPQVTEEAGP